MGGGVLMGGIGVMLNRKGWNIQAGVDRIWWVKGGHYSQIPVLQNSNDCREPTNCVCDFYM